MTTESPTFAAVDLGASSGRVVLGRLAAGRLETTEVHRFANGPVPLPDGLHWDAVGLFREVLTGLRAAGGPVSVGVDSWAVDYGLIDGSGSLLGEPFHYRDSRTDAVAKSFVDSFGAPELFARNGLQFLPFNTIFQLAAAKGAALESAEALLLIPDLIGYWLTGQVGAELTNASTTGLLDPRTHEWSPELARAAGIDPSLLPALRKPGDVVGELLPPVAEATGSTGTSVVAVGSHDTASAVVGVPARTPNFAYVCTGTWSLTGVELSAPVLTEQARRANFTNELGVDGTVRFLRNIMGLWLLQESLRTWGLTSEDLPGLLAEAARAEPLAAVVDAEDTRFLAPGDMPARIAEACRETDQPVPPTRGALVRCILESLALAHRRAVREAARLSDREVDVVHLVGGGARNELLCQLTADALGAPVVAGPVEATATGNLLVQARAAGHVADLAEIRRIIAASHHLDHYTPRGTTTPWDEAESRLPTRPTP
ncbi:rhamnulokinase [Saccharopolyspora mangrovi]|uniref:Rhamnulokinase family protein n=1 Tax=Saccharopolyspora mangrovi TaxID=3082379 RepID=A0ABU6AFQ4_9PSEU|nr:rhamnulokinase family protein [Saccharopolyspora sp. S2-29]MEB3370392.1 rhamnulokinase family protein [Saccharopolyspora sp. S2-29]